MEEIFELCNVLELPAVAGEWREYAMFVLESSLSFGDMIAEEAESVVQHGNGPWWWAAYVHYCLVGCCEAGAAELPGRAGHRIIVSSSICMRGSRMGVM